MSPKKPKLNLSKEVLRAKAEEYQELFDTSMREPAIKALHQKTPPHEYATKCAKSLATSQSFERILLALNHEISPLALSKEEQIALRAIRKTITKIQKEISNVNSI